MNKYSIHHCSWCSQNLPDVDETSENENPYTKETTVMSLMELLGLSANLLVRGAFYQLCNDCKELVSYGRDLGVQLLMVNTTVTKEIIMRQQNEVKTLVKNRTRRWISEGMMEPGEDGTLLLGQLLANCFSTCVLRLRSEGIAAENDQNDHRMGVEKSNNIAPQVNIIISRTPAGTDGNQEMEQLSEIQGDPQVEPEASSAPVESELQDSIVVPVPVPEPEEQSQEELQIDSIPASEPVVSDVALDGEPHMSRDKKISIVGQMQTEIAETAVEKDINGNNAFVASAELDPRVLIEMKTEVMEERLARNLEATEIVGQTNVNNNSIPADNQHHFSQLQPAQHQDFNIPIDDIISEDPNEPQPSKRTKFNDENILLQHSSEEVDVYECSGCDELLQSLKDKVDHENTHKMFQDPDGNMRYQCGICQMELFGYHELKLHRLTHLERPFVCDFCGKVCESEKSLEQHLEIHNLEMPFKCAFCEKKFLTYEDVVLHSQMHAAVPVLSAVSQDLNLEAGHEIEFTSTSDPPVALEKVHENPNGALRMPDTQSGASSQPEYTGQAIVLREAVQVQKRRIVFMHVHRCGGCWKTFKSVMALGYHEKSHLIYRGGSFWYKCKLCSVRYSDYMDLRSHRISHPPTRVTLKRISKQ